MRRFAKTLYFRCFLVSFVLEIAILVLGMIWPNQILGHRRDAAPPVVEYFVNGALVLAVGLVIVGGYLLIYNPWLRKYPDPPMSFDLERGGPEMPRRLADEDMPGNQRAPDPETVANWPDWRFTGVCVLLLAAGIFAFAVMANGH